MKIQSINNCQQNKPAFRAKLVVTDEAQKVIKAEISVWNCFASHKRNGTPFVRMNVEDVAKNLTQKFESMTQEIKGDVKLTRGYPAGNVYAVYENGESTIPIETKNINTELLLPKDGAEKPFEKAVQWILAGLSDGQAHFNRIYGSEEGNGYANNVFSKLLDKIRKDNV